MGVSLFCWVWWKRDLFCGIGEVSGEGKLWWLVGLVKVFSG